MTLLFASERTAAKLLDLTLKEFRELVMAGALPGPVTIGEKVLRWSIRDLSLISSGEAMSEEFQWA